MKKAIYKIENKINHKIYIGQSNNPTKRFKDHCRKNEKYKSLIHDAIIKYGEDNFSFEVIEWTEDYNNKEKFWIEYYRSLTPYGYNILKGGQEPPAHCGENSPNAKITFKVAQQIKKDLLNWKIPRKQIVKKYNISYDILRHINDGDSWKDENLSYPLRPMEKELNELRADKVIELLKTTKLTQKEIGQIVGWNRSAITMINLGKNHFRDDENYPIRK